MSDLTTATSLRTGSGAIVALSIAAATMFAIPYSTQAIVPEVGRDLGMGPAVTGLTITVVVVALR